MKKTTSKLLVTALSAVLGLALMGGAAAAAFVPVETTVTAEKKGPNTAKLEQVLNALVTAGMITAAQRDAILAKLAEAAAPKEEDTDEDEDGDEQKKDSEKSKKELDPKLRFNIQRLLTNWQARAVAFIGLERKVVQERLRNGDSYSEMAVAQGKTEALLIAAIAESGLEKIAAHATKHQLSAEQKTALEGRLTAAIEKLVQHESKPKPRAAQAPKTERAATPKTSAAKPAEKTRNPKAAAKKP